MDKTEYKGDARRQAALKGIDKLRGIIADNNNINPRDLLTIQELRGEIPYSRPWIYSQIRSGKFEVYSTGKRRFLYRPQVLKALNLSKD